jgi:hypothetical protein
MELPGEISQNPQNSRLKLFGALILSIILLSLEGFIIVFIVGFWNVDGSPIAEDGMTSGAITAWEVVAGIVLIWGIILLFRKKNKNHIPSLNWVSVVGGMSMILLAIVFGQFNIAAINAQAQNHINQDAEQLNTTTRILTLTEAPVVGANNKQIGIHLEYAIQLLNGYSLYQSPRLVPLEDLGFSNPAEYDWSINDFLYGLQESSSSLIKTMTSPSGTHIEYGSYDLVPIYITVQGGDATGNPKNFCLTNIPITEDNEQIQSFLNDYASTTRGLPVKFGIVWLTDGFTSFNITTTTSNSYDLESFFEAAKQEASCSN